MEVKIEIKQKIVQAIKAEREKYSSDAKHSVALGINKAVYSQIMKGKIERVLAETAWLTLGRKFNVNSQSRLEWMPARTPVFEFITKQLFHCLSESTTGLFCDKAGIGKTFAAKEFCRNNPNAVYIDCSEHPTKYALVRAIAKAFGLDNTGKLKEVTADLVYYLKTLHRPLIILDEAGDLDNLAWLMLKSLHNMLEDWVGWYMMGANGLKARIQRNITFKTVGFEELFDRYGAEFQHLTPKSEADFAAFNRHQAKLILEANRPSCKDATAVLNRCQLSLRRLKKEITKMNKTP